MVTHLYRNSQPYYSTTQYPSMINSQFRNFNPQPHHHSGVPPSPLPFPSLPRHTVSVPSSNSSTLSTQNTPVPVSLPTDLRLDSAASLPANYYAIDKRQYPSIPPNGFLARIHGYGIFGYVSFIPLADNLGNMDIKVHLEGGPPKEEYALKVYSLPTQMGSPCMASLLGPMVYDLTFDYGPVSSKDELRFRTKLADIMNRGILGRTLFIQGLMSGIRICANILTGETIQLYQVKFHSPIAGMAYLMQTSIESALGTEWMMYSDGKRKFTAHNWSLLKADIQQNEPQATIKNEKEK